VIEPTCCVVVDTPGHAVTVMATPPSAAPSSTASQLPIAESNDNVGVVVISATDASA
jgi:hypothetical protein